MNVQQIGNSSTALLCHPQQNVKISLGDFPELKRQLASGEDAYEKRLHELDDVIRRKLRKLSSENKEAKHGMAQLQEELVLERQTHAAVVQKYVDECNSLRMQMIAVEKRMKQQEVLMSERQESMTIQERHNAAEKLRLDEAERILKEREGNLAQDHGLLLSRQRALKVREDSLEASLLPMHQHAEAALCRSSSSEAEAQRTLRDARRTADELSLKSLQIDRDRRLSENVFALRDEEQSDRHRIISDCLSSYSLILLERCQGASMLEQRCFALERKRANQAQHAFAAQVQDVEKDAAQLAFLREDLRRREVAIEEASLRLNEDREELLCLLQSGLEEHANGPSILARLKRIRNLIVAHHHESPISREHRVMFGSPPRMVFSRARDENIGPLGGSGMPRGHVPSGASSVSSGTSSLLDQSTSERNRRIVSPMKIK